VITTTDRAEVIHFAGRHHLSPALRDGAPALVAHGEAGARCGWATFFAALEARGLAARLDPEDVASFALAPRAEAAHGHARAGNPGAEARRFLAALRGRLDG
jgi:hypothetical protein